MSGTIEPVALRKSAATVHMTPSGCDLQVPYSGHLAPQSKAAITSALRRLIIEMRYGTRLKGLTVSTADQTLTVTAVASKYTIQKWLDSGELIAAVDSAVAQARRSGR